MANETKGEVPLVVGEGDKAETFTLVFDANAFCEVEWALDGKTADELLAEGRRGRFGFRTVRAILYGGLQARHPCNLIRAGEILEEVGIARGRVVASKGLLIAFGKNPDDVDDEEDEAAEGGEAPRP